MPVKIEVSACKDEVKLVLTQIRDVIFFGNIDLDSAYSLRDQLARAIDKANDYEPSWRDYKDKYKPHQIQFCEDMEAKGWGEHIDSTYSGRGMFGETCPSICTQTRSDKDDYRTESDVIRATAAELSIDTMGLEVVLYAR